MPAIADSVTANRLAAIKTHANSEKFKKRVRLTIAEIKSFANHPGINKNVPPNIWVSYGKDSTALWLLCVLANIEFVPCFIDHRMEIPQHYSFVEEWNDWVQDDSVVYTTEYDGIDYLWHSLESHRRERRQQEKETGELSTKPPITFFEPQEAYASFYWLTTCRFMWQQIGTEENTLNFWSTRGSEGMGRQWELSKNGKMFQPAWSLKKGETPVWRSLPVGDWQDLDIWALLLSFDAPVSPVYGMNEISQRGKGRNSYPRTVWYCDSHVFNVQFCKWLKHYAPACLSQVMTYFPEVGQKLGFKKKNG